MNPVVHFELPADDRERMAAFYQKAFDWETNMLGPEMGEYVLVKTSETDENNMVKAPGTINGGLFKRSKESFLQNPSIVIHVNDIESSIKKVKEAGGEVIDKPQEIPGVGIIAYFKDSEGNINSMLQPTM